MTAVPHRVMDLALGVNDCSLVGPQLGARDLVQTSISGLATSFSRGLTEREAGWPVSSPETCPF
jgi:hypothetical protein